MFGYIKIEKEELKVREYNLFKAYYCGLCTALKKVYGFPARYFLSYDVTFLLVLLASIKEEDMSFEPIRCMANPALRRPSAKPNEVLSYAAVVNVLLAWFKLLDDWQDHRSLKALLLLPWMYCKQKKAKKLFPALFKNISEQLSALKGLEQAQCDQPDRPADTFGKLMREIFDTPLAGTEENRRVLSHLGYLLGRFIYLLDAWADREEDRRKQSYNPFLLAKDLPEADVKLSVEYTLSQVADSMELLSFKRNRPIVENIIYLGLKRAFDSVFGGEACKCNQKEKRHERPL